MSASRRLNRSTRAPPTDGVPSRTPRDIYAEMLADAGVGRSPEPQRPLKRRKARRSADREDDSISCGGPSAYGERGAAGSQVDQDDDEEGIEFEDVEIPKPTIQTMYMGSEDEDSEEEDNAVGFEDIDLNVPVPDEKGAAPSEPKAMELNLTAQKAAMSPAKRKGPKKKPLSREEKARRVEVHKMHLLCLLYHCAMRNKWCNDEKVQKCLKALLTQQMVNHLNPSRKLTQFGRTEALKKGLEEVGHMFRIKYQITERGLRRALWAEDREDLNKVRSNLPLLACRSIVLTLYLPDSMNRLRTWRLVWTRRTSLTLRGRFRAPATWGPSSIARYYEPLGFGHDLCAPCSLFRSSRVALRCPSLKVLGHRRGNLQQQEFRLHQGLRRRRAP